MLKGAGGPRSLPAQAPLAEPLEPRTHLAAAPVLHDLNPKLDGADPQPGITIGNTLYFAAESELGRELWKTDGTVKGTRLVIDLAPGPDSSNPKLLTNVNGVLFFTTTDAERRSTLWRSDGTADGTRTLITTTNEIDEARAALGKLFFTIYHSDTGEHRVWVSDGTPTGTTRLPRTLGQDINFLAEYQGRLLFAAGRLSINSRRGWRIYWTDGTPNGTGPVPFFEGKKSMYHFRSGLGDLFIYGWFTPNFIVHEGDLYLHHGHDDGYGRTSALWRTDLKKAVRLFPHGGKTNHAWKATKEPLYFHSLNSYPLPTDGEIWRTDGTPQGTRRLKNVRPGLKDSNPKLLEGPLQPSLRYFFASSEKRSQELWITDGTTAGTKSLLTLGPTDNAYGVYGERVEAVQLGRRLLFVNDTPDHGRELWTSDGTRDGTNLLRDFAPGPADGLRRFLGTLNGKAVIVAEDSTGEAIYVTEGTAAGTRALKHISPRTAPSNPRNFTPMEGQLYFTTGPQGYGHHENLTHLWRGDGTRAGSSVVRSFAHANIEKVLAVGGKLYLAIRRSRRSELWVSDGTAAGTRRLAKGTGMTFTEFNGELFFATTDRGDPYRASPGESMALFRTDGTTNGTTLVRRFPLADTPHTWAILEGRLLFVAADENAEEMLWSTDGTPAGTIPLASANDGSAITVDGTRAFFTGNDSANGMELWVTDGTPQGSRMITNMRVAALNAMPENQVMFKGLLHFTAYFGTDYRRGLWRTDGTEAGTELLLHHISVEDIAVMDEHLYFTGRYDGKSGLWKSDGTAAGTGLLFETPIAFNRHSEDFRLLDGVLYFSAYDPAHGQEPWRSDGTIEGTAILADLNPGSASSGPLGFTRFSDKLLFSADDGRHGQERWDIPLA